MSRPVIMKVEKYEVQQNQKATGSIEKEILRKNTDEEEEIQVEHEQYSSLEDLKSCSLVRSLINKYESTSENKILKYKSKSLVDLQKPKSTPEPTTQDDYFLNRKKYKETEDESGKFNFGKVVSMFQNLERSSNSNITQNAPTYKNKVFKMDVPKDFIDIGIIKQKAALLLETQPSFDKSSSDYHWQNEVVSLLNSISKVDSRSGEVAPLRNRQYVNESIPQGQEIESTAEMNGFYENVEDNNNSYLEGNRILTKPIIIYADEDGVNEQRLKSDPQPITSDGNEEEDFSDSASSDTIQFASLEFAEQNKIDFLESCRQLLNDLMKDVEDYELQIERLTPDDLEEGENIKKVLKKILAELQDVQTDDEEELVNKKKEAIDYVQKCVTNLNQLQ